MTNQGEWKREFPGAGAAENVRKMLRQRLQDLENGKVKRVERALRGESWLRDVDLVGVPDTVVSETRQILAEPEVALRRDADVAAARDAVQRALVIW